MVLASPQHTSTQAESAIVAHGCAVLPFKPEWIRLPLPGARCPHTGLSRTTLCELSTPCPANDNKPPVKSVLIKKRNALRGIRLINFDSLMAHLAVLPNTGGEEGGREG